MMNTSFAQRFNSIVSRARDAVMKLAAMCTASVLALGLGAAQAQDFLVNKKFVNQIAAPTNSQINVIGPTQTALLEFNLFNSSGATLTAQVTDNLPLRLDGDATYTAVVTDYQGTVNGNGCAGPATVTVDDSTIVFTGVIVPNIPAAGINPDCRIYFRVIGDPLEDLGGGSNKTNTVPAGGASATGGAACPTATPCLSDTFSASVQIPDLIAATVTKAFGRTEVPVGGETNLVITIRNNASYPLTNVGLNDTLPTGVVPLTTPAPTTTCAATPAPSVTVLGQTVTLAGGGVPANGTCTVTVRVQGTVPSGTSGSPPAPTPYTNTIPVATGLTTQEGVQQSGPATAQIAVRNELTMEKRVDGVGSVNKTQGQVVRVSVAFTNFDVAVSGTSFTDNLPVGMSVAATPSFASNCSPVGAFGGPATVPTVTGFGIPAADLSTGAPGTCTLSFFAVVTATSGTLVNSIAIADVVGTAGGNPKSPLNPTEARVNVTPSVGPGPGPGSNATWGYVDVYKDFVNQAGVTVNRVDLGDTYWMRMGAVNPGYDWRFTDGSMTDTLPVGMLVNVGTLAPAAGTITLTPGTDLVYFGNGNQTSQGPDVLGTNYSGCQDTGLVTVNRAAVAGGFQDTITYSGWTLKGKSETGNASGVWFQNGCWFSVQLKAVAAGAYTQPATPTPTLPAKPTNTIPASNITGIDENPAITNTAPATAPLIVLSEVGVRKTFNSYVVQGGPPAKRVRLSIWLTNKAAVAQTGATFTDTLPTAGGWTVVVASPNGLTNSCGGTVTAAAGSGSVSLTGGTIPSGSIPVPGECLIEVDVDVTGPAGSAGPLDNIIPPGGLTTDAPGVTNVVEARGALFTRPLNVTLNKVFGNGGAAQGGTPVPMTITVTGDQWPLNNVSFTDDLVSVQAGLVVAPNPNITTTCRTIDTVTAPFAPSSGDALIYRQSATLATVTAVAGTTTISLAGAYFPGSAFTGSIPGSSNSCTVTVDVVASTTGNKTNTIPVGNVTTTEGATNNSPSSATLTVQPNTQLVKSFSPTSITAGTPFTLTFTVFNVNTSPQNGFTITDNLPSGVTAVSPGANTCGGTLSITGGGTGIELTGGGTNVAPNGSCQFTVNMQALAAGAYTNNQSNITATATINTNTSTTVTVAPAVAIDLSVTKEVSATTPPPYLTGVSQVAYTLTARSNGPGAAQQGIVVKDCLPNGLSYVSATGTNWSCVNNAGPITYGSLTCSSEVVCTRTGGGVLVLNTNADPITVTANVTASAAGSLVNYAQVVPAAGDLPETNPLGTTDGGYETGDPAVGSNNDASAAITVTAAYSLGNRVWYDTNNDGALNVGESPISGVKVQLLDSALAPVPGQVVLTDANGYYRFDGLIAGTYSVRVTPDNWTGLSGSLPLGTTSGPSTPATGAPLAGYQNSTPTETAANSTGILSVNNTDKGINPATAAAYTTSGVTTNPVTLGAGSQPTASDIDAGATGAGAASPSGDSSDNLTVDIGFYRLTVGNEVFTDLNNNGVKDGADAAVNGVTVELLKSGIVVATTTTSGGTYSFTQGLNGAPLLAGNDYQVRLPGAGIPLGFTSSSDIGSTSNPTGASNGTDSDDNGKIVGSTIITDDFTLSAATTLPPGASVTDAATATTGNPTVDFGLAPTYSIGNRVWFDTNNDGILNNSETAAGGVKVQLLDNAGVPIVGQSVLTDVNGYYRFDSLPAGTYAVQITGDNWTGLTGNLPLGTTAGALTPATGAPLAGYQSSTGVIGVTTGTGSTNNNDKGIDPSGAYATAGVRSANVVLGLNNQPSGDSDAASGTAGPGLAGDPYDNLTVDFGFYRLTVGDTVWRDDGAGTVASYNNGLRDAGEPPLPNVTVELRRNGILVAVTTTDSNGFYVFSQQTTAAGVGTGEPIVADTTYTITIPANQTALAGLKSSATPSTQPAVTTVGTGTLDDGDKGLGNALSTSVTASAAFTLAVGPIGAAPDANNTYSLSQAGTNNGTSHKPDMDFGFVPTFAIGNRIWFDTNNNGAIDATEVGANGVLVELTDGAGAKLYRTSATDPTPTTSSASGLPIEATTASGGYYLVDELPAGTFRVRVASSNWSAAGPLSGYQNSTGVTNQGPTFVTAQNNRDHGTDPATAAAYPAAGVSSADIVLGTLTVGTGDTTEVGGAIGTPPSSVSGNANDNLTIDFGFYRLTIGNLVWSDSGAGSGGVYNDGIRNGTEPGLVGVGVQLLDALGNVVAQTVTDANGNYSFTQLTTAPAPTGSGSNLVYAAGVGNGQPIVAGNYTVRIPANQTITSGSTSSADTAGGRTTGDSQDNGVGTAFTTSNTDTSVFAIAPGSTASGSTAIDATGSTDQPRIDFGFAPGFAIGNRVWFDTNNNGVIDAGEAAIPNVLVELLDSTNTVVRTTATNPTGEYLFENLGTGSFTVRVARENWTGLTAAQVAAAGSPAGLAAGQRPLAGYSNSAGAGAVGSTATDATDKGLDAADPTISGISSPAITLGVGLQPLGEAGTGDNDGVGPTTSLDANNNMTIDFGFYRLTVGDLVWRDDGNSGATPANVNNGVRDAGEVGIAGVRVELYKGGVLVAVAITGANGDYLFTEGTDVAGVANGKPLVPGTDYQVRIPQATGGVNTPLANLLSSAANASSETTPLAANDDDSGTGTGAASAGVTASAVFTLGAGTGAGANTTVVPATGTTGQPNVDFGFAPSYSLGNRVWIDANNDGILNGAEVGLAGVTVRLLNAGGNPVPGVADQLTAANGFYRFDNLPPGTYIVEIVPGAVAGVNYVSSTGQNASLTGPFEPGLTSTAVSTNDRDHGRQTTLTTIRSAPVVLGPSNLVTSEVNSGATGAGANGPLGDVFDVLTADFGVFLPARVGNFVWFDTNANGAADPGEPGLNGIVVNLLDGSGNFIATQVTVNNPNTGNPGFYEFTNLIPGQYSVQFISSSLISTAPGTPAGTNGSQPDTNNSQLPSGTSIGSTQVVTLAAGDNNPQLDAGFINPIPIPTMSQWAKLLLALLIFAAVLFNRRRRA